MTPATKDALTQADIIFNRTSVALARSQRLIASWLPPKDEETSTPTQGSNPADEDDDFRGDTELGGIGSPTQRDDSGLPEGAFKRRTPGANDKLLDSLLGKKAANAHRKSLALAKSAAAQQGGEFGGLAKPVVKEKEKAKRPAQDSDSEEEGGRAAAFKSKRARPAKAMVRVEEDGGEVEGELRVDVDVEIAKGDGEDKTTETTLEPPTQSTNATPKAGGRKRPASYLDELLGQKENKKSKKKKKSAAAATADGS